MESTYCLGGSIIKLSPFTQCQAWFKASLSMNISENYYNSPSNTYIYQKWNEPVAKEPVD